MAGAIGTINWWGFSPTINLLDFVNHEKNKDESNNAAELCVDDTTGAQLVAVPKDSSEKICDNPGAPVNILLVGASDCRHILKIMAEIAAGKYTNRPIHLYVVESRMEVLARHMLLLDISLRSAG
eukprot:gene3824-6334_t